MDGNLPAGSHELGDVNMTDAQDVHENIFDEMLADWDETWGNGNPDYPFMLDDDGVPDSVIDPALLNESARLPTYPNASASVPSGATDQQASVNQSESNAAHVPSTPIREHSSIGSPLPDPSPTSSGLHTPSRTYRGHYGSGRRRTGALSNFQPIAMSPSRGNEAGQSSSGYQFEPIPEHQQGILSPSNYNNDDIPEFQPRGIQYNLHLNVPDEEPASNGPAASQFAFGGAATTAGAGGNQFQGSEYVIDEATLNDAWAQLQLSLQNQPTAPSQPLGIAVPHSPSDLANAFQSANDPAGALQSATGQITSNTLPTNYPVAPLTTTNTAAANVAPTWNSGMTFDDEPDPARRANLRQVARVSHMLLNPQTTLVGIQNAMSHQAARAAELARAAEIARAAEEANKAKKKPAKRPRKSDTNNNRNTGASASANAPGTANKLGFSNQSLPTNQAASTTRPTTRRSSGQVSVARASRGSPLTIQDRRKQFWAGRWDKTGNELESSILCHGVLHGFHPLGNIDSVNQAASGQYDNQIPDTYPRLAEDVGNPLPQHSHLMVFSEMMNAESYERAVYSGQVLIASYDSKSNWWHKLLIWAHNREPMSRFQDEIAVVITPFHIIFGRIPPTEDLETLKRDWLSIIGIIDQSFHTPPVAAEQKPWAFMYRLLPIVLRDRNDLQSGNEQFTQERLALLKQLHGQSVYAKRFRVYPYYIPALGVAEGPHNFGIRVARFGFKGEFDRPRLEIRDFAGQRKVQD